jgi:hypothetical protein
VGRQWVIWDPYWRPIDAIEWTGTEWHVNDRTYSADPTDHLYLFGSFKLKHICENLPDPSEEDVYTGWIGTPEWFFDRPVVLGACAPRTLESWKRMGVRRRTFKARPGRKTFTKRTWK